MAIDKNGGIVSGRWIYKYITVGKLKEILDKLPDNSEIVVNTVGNLLIYRLAHDEAFDMFGFIDLATEELETFS